MDTPTLRRAVQYIAVLAIAAVIAMLTAILAATHAGAVPSDPALPVTSSSTPAPTSPATFQPYGLTCAWILGTGATAAHPFDDGHGKAIPQAFLTCITATTAPSPACGKTITEQVDHYTITSVKMAADFAALIKTGILNGPAEDAEFTPHDWTYPVFTGPACATATPTPTVTPTTSTPAPSTSVPVPSTTPPAIHLGTPAVSVAPVTAVPVAATTPDALASTGTNGKVLLLAGLLAVALLTFGTAFLLLGRRTH